MVVVEKSIKWPQMKEVASSRYLFNFFYKSSTQDKCLCSLKNKLANHANVYKQFADSFSS